MSWLSGLRPSTSNSSESDLREAKRQKLQADRLRRTKERVDRQNQLQAAINAQREADQALKDLLNIDPELFSGGGSENLSEEEVQHLLDIMEDFETENGTDGQKALEKMGSVKCDFSKEDIEFWFTELESQLEVIEVKSQWTKRIALQRFLPAEIKQEIKTLLKIQKANAGTDIYKRIKTELINLFGDKPEDAYTRARNRVMTGKPSQLGKALVDDICVCDVKLSSVCCARVIWGMYREALPVVIRNHISDMTFNKDTYLQVFKKSDQVYDSNQPQLVKQATVAAVSTQPTTTQTLDSEVAAVRPPKKPKNQNRNNSGGAQQNQQSAPKPQAPAANKGPRHATAKGDNEKLCRIHYKWGDNGSYCAAPWKCPMKSVFKAPQ